METEEYAQASLELVVGEHCTGLQGQILQSEAGCYLRNLSRMRNMKSQSGVEVGEHCRSVDEIICLVEVSYR